MTTSFKKYIANIVIMVSAFAGIGLANAAAPPSFNPQGNAVISNVSVNGTNYDFTYFTGTYAEYAAEFTTTYMPFYGNSASANSFAAAFFTATGGVVGTSTGGTYGTVNNYFGYSGGVAFAYDSSGNAGMPLLVGTYTVGNNGIGSAGASAVWGTAQLSTGAPEIDGSLAPKVGFLLGCLFLMFGRKKQNTEPMLTA